MQALLCPTPDDRLGLGIGCRAGLKEHIFFTGHEWRWDATPPHIDAYLPPLQPGAYHYYGSKRDGSNLVNVEASARASLEASPVPDLARLLDPKALATVQAEQQIASPWAGFCREHECVVIANKAIWRRGFHGQNVYAVLLSSGRLLLLDALKLEEIVNTNICEGGLARGQLHTEHLIFLHTTRKTYYLIFEGPVAASWIVVVQAVSLCNSDRAEKSSVCLAKEDKY